MKRRCEESVPLLGPWIDGELADEDSAWLAEHVGCCETCSARKALLEAQRDAVREAVVARAACADPARDDKATQLYKGKSVKGQSQEEYSVDALPAGTYWFQDDKATTMWGQVQVPKSKK